MNCYTILIFLSLLLTNNTTFTENWPYQNNYNYDIPTNTFTANYSPHSNTNNPAHFHANVHNQYASCNTYKNKRSQKILPIHYSFDQLKAYFNYHHYTQEQILSLNTMYMSNEFVKFAKTYPGYAAAITSLYNKIHHAGFFKKLNNFRRGYHCQGLSKRLAFLYREIQNNRSNNIPQAVSRQQNIALPYCQKKLISILESHTNQITAVESITQLAEHVFNQAEYNNFFKVVMKIHEAYNDFIKNNDCIKNKVDYKFEKGKCTIEGKTKENIIIEMVITQKGHMVTAYPILGKKL
jgi:hypothetical protein